MPNRLQTTTQDASTIQILTGINPAQALGFAVGYLMTKPAFARLPFGHWSRTLVGQINRGHYLIASQQDRIVGFLGWALTSNEKAEQWLADQQELSFADSQQGEIILINAWAAQSNMITRILLRHLREIGQNQEMVFFKRFYPDGRIRPGRLSVNAFVNRHVRNARES